MVSPNGSPSSLQPLLDELLSDSCTSPRFRVIESVIVSSSLSPVGSLCVRVPPSGPFFFFGIVSVCLFSWQQSCLCVNCVYVAVLSTPGCCHLCYHLRHVSVTLGEKSCHITWQNRLEKINEYNKRCSWSLNDIPRHQLESWSALYCFNVVLCALFIICHF